MNDSTRPHPCAALIGRDALVERVQQQLAQQRLLLLTGPLGCGKTRLALQLLAQHRAAGLPCQVVDLAQRESLPVAHAEPGHLLVLDHADAGLDACQRFAVEYLRNSAQAQVLLCSRESPPMAASCRVAVPPLTFPPLPVPLRDETVACYTALQLLIARLRAQQADFSPTPEQLGHLGQLCCELDGMPLALERAAQIGDLLKLPCASVVARLLKDGQPLKQALEWQYARLDRGERLALQRLAIFEQPFTAAAAIAVTRCSELRPDVVEHLMARLSACSLLETLPSAGPSRYRLLNLTRHFAREKLTQSGQRAVLDQRLASYLGQSLRLSARSADGLRLEQLGSAY